MSEPSVMTDHDRASDQLAAGAGALAPIVAGALLVSVRGVMDNTNIALALVVVVVGAGALGGRMAGGLAAVTAALSFNFFHTKPYLSLQIHSADDVETMTLLLAIGLVVGQVAAVARRRGTKARRGREEVERVWRVVEQAVSGADLDELVTTVGRELSALLRLHEWSWRPGDAPSTLPTLQVRGILEPRGVHHFAGGDFELPREGFAVPVADEGRVLGHFHCVPTLGVGVGLDARRTAVVLASTVALASRSGRPSTARAGAAARAGRGREVPLP